MINPQLTSPAKPACILIVDDENLNRELLRIILAPDGFELQMASGGKEALAMVAENPPDLILLDVMMPELNGYEVSQRLKENPATQNIPIILISALDDRDARLLGLNAGAEDYLSKPVDRAELSMRVRNLLRLKSYSDHYNDYSRQLEAEVGVRTSDLAESERLYRSTFNAAPVGIAHVGLDGKWLQVNERLCELLGYSCEEIEGVTAGELLQTVETGRDLEAYRQLADGTLDRYVVDEKSFRHRNGTVVWTRVNVSVHRDANWEPQHFIMVIEDISERMKLEAQIRQAGKMDAIGRLASGVAHDFNNLLTVILGFAEIVTNDVGPETEQGKDVKEIMKAARRAAGLTSQLLAFSRQQILNAVPLDVNSLIVDMAGMLERLIGEHIEISTALAPDVHLALVDKGQLEQVVMNLVVNARDAMPGGGRITIETGDATLDSSAFHQEKIVHGPYVMLAITDTGAGMSSETKQRLFEPFFTTKAAGKGTGLGLSTTYGIIKQSKGYIWVYSEPGQGTTFKVYLPRSISSVPTAPTAPSISTNRAKPSETLLLVEDETGVRQLSKRILAGAGYRVLDAADGNAAEKIFAENADQIALVLTDVVMPGCGGPELAERLRLKDPAIRVMYMSGYTDHLAVGRTGLGNSVGFVQKPFTAAALLTQVREALDGENSMAGTQQFTL